MWSLPFFSIDSRWCLTKLLLFCSQGALKMIIILCILCGINIFEYINQPRPSWWIWCTENKLYACMMLFFLSNLIEGQLMQSGAFEITLNDVPVWSSWRQAGYRNLLNFSRSSTATCNLTTRSNLMVMPNNRENELYFESTCGLSRIFKLLFCKI